MTGFHHPLAQIKRFEPSRAIRLLLVPVLLLAAWQWLTVADIIPPNVMASPQAALRAAWDLLQNGTLLEAVGWSLRRALIGVVLGAALGFVLGVLAGYWLWGENLIDANMQMLRTIPFVALGPVFIAWFGIGETVKLSLVVFATVFPVYIGTYEGIRGLDRRLIEVARVTGLGTWETVREIIAPGALASVLLGLRYALTLSIISLVVAEQINVNGGIGALMFDARAFMQTDVMALCLALYALLGLGANAVARLLEARLLRWRKGVLPS
ncbi:MAG: ABC transporter permease [Xenophilus sp.]